MANIQKRPNGRWRARYRDEAGKEHARHFRRRVDAQRWLDEVTTSVVTGTYVDPRVGQVTFTAFFDQWSDRQVWAEGTRLAARQAASSVPFGNAAMNTIRPSHVESWVKEMSMRLAPSTVRTRFNYVNMAFAAAVKDRVISTSPTQGTSLPRRRRAGAAMTIPSPEQVHQAMDCAQQFRGFVAVCAFAGLRLGEAAGLQLADIDVRKHTLQVRRQVQGETNASTRIVPPKFESERVVYMPEALTDLLSAEIAAWGTWGEEGWLFGWGRLLNRQRAGHLWRQTRQRAGLDQFTLHDLRHFFASGLIAEGCDVVTVQRALGHSSPSITLGVYSHLWPDAEDRTRAAAANLMARSGGPIADSPLSTVL